MAILTIDDVAMPKPKKYSIQKADADSKSTSRSETYVLHRNVVKQGIYRIDVTYSATWSELKTITDAIAPSSFVCKFLDATLGVLQTSRTMYAGNRSCIMVQLLDEADYEESQWELTVALIDTCAT